MSDQFLGKLLLLCALLLSSACGDATPVSDGAANSDGATDAAASEDASAPSDAGPDASSDASAQCTSVIEGAAITSSAMSAESPAPTGGAISDGDYQLRSAVAYVGMGAAPMARTLSGAIRFRGTNAELVLTERGTTTAVSGTFSTSGTSVSLAWTCPRPAPARGYPYNATATRFDWFLPPNLVLTFVKQ